MNVVYVSKALVVAAYRDKIRELERVVRVRSVIPERWGRDSPEPSPPGLAEPVRVLARLTGHNHLHHYVRPERWLAAPRPDLAHVDEEPYSLVTYQLARVCRRLGVPFVFFAWQNIDRPLPPPFGRLRRAVLRSARGGIAGTERAAAILRDHGFSGPLAVIPQFGVDAKRFRPDAVAGAEARARLRVPADAFTVGYAGRLVPEKGVDILLQAFAGLDADPRRPAPCLVLAGTGPDRPRLEGAARAAGVADRVRFAGHVPSLEMPGILNALDVLVLPSLGTRTWSEQFGRVLVEAMACGVPVVGASTGEIPSVIGDAGEVLPPGDTAALSAALVRLRDSAAARERHAGAGLERVGSRYTNARIARSTADFYADLVPREST